MGDGDGLVDRHPWSVLGVAETGQGHVRDNVARAGIVDGRFGEAALYPGNDARVTEADHGGAQRAAHCVAMDFDLPTSGYRTAVRSDIVFEEEALVLLWLSVSKVVCHG